MRAILDEMATESDLQAKGFQRCSVTALTLNIAHPDPNGLGPFCRLRVADDAPARPGVYAWTQNGTVMYVGMATQLRQVVHGARMGRAYNDYTYIPPSKVGQLSSPRVRVNGLLNRAFCDSCEVSWWWRETLAPDEATRLEAHLITDWYPAWNRARPTVT